MRSAQGMGDRYHLLPGSAFDVDYGTDLDAVLITNLLHHFEPAENEKMLKKVACSPRPGRAGDYPGVCAE